MIGNFLFDDRSALLQRSTGWERYARELQAALVLQAPSIHCTELAVHSVGRRLRTDWLDLPRAVRSSESAHFPTFPPTPPSLGGRTRVSYTLHDCTWWRYPQYSSRLGRSYYRPLAERAVHKAELVITDSESVRAEILDFFGLAPQKVLTVYPGVATSGPSECCATRRTRPYFLAVGTLEPRKNLKRLVEAFRISGLQPTHDLIIIGRKAWGPELRGAEILTDVCDANLWRLYEGAVALVNPSLYEGFGLPLVEAAAVGTAVLCSDIPVFREVTQGVASFFDPNDVESIALELERAVEESPFSREEYKAVAATYTWQAAAKKLLDAHEALVE